MFFVFFDNILLWYIFLKDRIVLNVKDLISGKYSECLQITTLITE